MSRNYCVRGSKKTVSEAWMSLFVCEFDFMIGENSHRTPRIYAVKKSTRPHNKKNCQHGERNV